MLGLAGSAAVFLYQEPIDLRKGFEGLSLVVEQEFKKRPHEGAVLGRGCFSKGTDKQKMERREFFMLLEGVTPKHLKKNVSKLIRRQFLFAACSPSIRQKGIKRISRMVHQPTHNILEIFARIDS